MFFLNYDEIYFSFSGIKFPSQSIKLNSKFLNHCKGQAKIRIRITNIPAWRNALQRLSYIPARKKHYLKIISLKIYRNFTTLPLFVRMSAFNRPEHDMAHWICRELLLSLIPHVGYKNVPMYVNDMATLNLRTRMFSFIFVRGYKYPLTSYPFCKEI